MAVFSANLRKFANKRINVSSLKIICRPLRYVLVTILIGRDYCNSTIRFASLYPPITIENIRSGHEM